jgi:hypothetical protein
MVLKDSFERRCAREVRAFKRSITWAREATCDLAQRASEQEMRKDEDTSDMDLLFQQTRLLCHTLWGSPKHRYRH